MSTRFNTDTGALNTRADLNASRAKHDLEDWMMQFLPALEGRRMVDLGCGSGKQIMRFAPLVGPEGSILGIDASAQAVEEVRAKAGQAGYAWVEAEQLGLDDSVDFLADRSFDLVVSTYAIYYASDFVKLLKDLGDRMPPGGELLVVGPGTGTNREISDIVARLSPSASEKLYVSDFIDEAGIAALADHFGGCETHRLDNPIRFHGTEEVMAWWRNHNSYVPDLEAEARAAIEAQLDEAGQWYMTKSLLALHCRVQ